MLRWIALRGFVVATGLVGGVILCELLFRLALPFLPGPIRDQVGVLAPGLRDLGRFTTLLHQEDPELVFTMRPSTTLEVQLRSDLPVTKISTNAFGYRGPDPTTAPVLVVGDSIVFGYGVDDDETFGSELSRRLGVDVATMGVSGYATFQYNAMLHRLDLPKSGQVVVYVVTLSNDFGGIRDDAERLPARSTPGLLEDLNIWASSYSVVLQVLKWSINTGAYRHGRHAQEDGLDLYFYFDNSKMDLGTERVRQAFEKVAENLTWAAARVRDAEAELAFVLMPSKESAYRHIARKHAPSPEFFAAEEMLREKLATLFEERGWRALDLTHAFRSRAREGEQLYFVYDGHWNPAGHELAAREILDYLVEERLALSANTERTRLEPPSG